MEIKEIWKDIKGYESLYQVSNYGNVRSLLFGKIRRLKANKNSSGYLTVALCKQGEVKTCYVHRLVARAFCDNPHNHNYVNHKDYNRENNNCLNLEWCTAEENIRYSASRMRHPKIKCKPSNTGEKYIYLTKNGSYRVQIKHKCYDRRFKTLDEAVEYRNEEVNGINDSRIVS